ncbi:cardiotrophin-2-like [Mixophyes fleayi]|uniref:cardiotrophin-2-like n=1 Tax=Mixophyes fleayi TaxID=3061075 RepID=UPI003F4D94CF
MLARTVILAFSLTVWYWGSAAAPLKGEEVLTQIQSLSTLHYTNATLMLSTYVQYQGTPFSNPGFSFPSWLEDGLPNAALGFREWRCLCPGTRLMLARAAFAAISEFLQLVLDDQYGLNPQAADLHKLLEASQRVSEALLSNLNEALLVLGFQPPSIQPGPLSWASRNVGDFAKKVRGYVLCREYKDWLMRVSNDTTILRQARGRRESVGLEKKDCCRS